jgi:ankyrin repeat protein
MRILTRDEGLVPLSTVYVAQIGGIEVVKLLLELGADLNSRDKKNAYP